REGARFAAAHTGDGTTLQNVKDLVTTEMAGRDSELANFQITVANVNPDTGTAIAGTQWNDAPFGGTIMVKAEGDYAPMLPTFLKEQTSLHLTATAMISSEAN